MARTGKIARMTKEQRDEINRMLRDGRPGSEIIAWAKEKTGVEINDVNLTNWRQGGHAEWLAQEARLDEMAAKREFALEIVRQNEGSKLHEAGLQLAASQIYDVISEFDPQALKEMLGEKPEEYANVVNALTKLSKGTLEVEKYKEQVRARAEAIGKELAAAKAGGGLTAETIQRIEEELKLL